MIENLVSIKNNASWYNYRLDSKYNPGRNAADDAMRHFQDCEKHPTTALLARKATEKYNLPSMHERNKKLLLEYPNVKNASDSFEATYKVLYPRTGEARKFLIEKKLVVLDKVKQKTWTLGKQLFKWFRK